MTECPIFLQHNIKGRTKAFKIITLLCVPLILFSRPMGLDQPHLDLILESFGRTLVILGVFGRLWAYLHIAGKKSKVLVATGPYALCRHPLYFFSLMITIGVGLLLENPLLFALILLVFLRYHSLAVEHEEKKLLDIFGARYQAYRNQTPKLFPNIAHLRGNFRSATVLTGNSGLVAKHLREAIGLSLLPPLAEMAEDFHRIGVLPDIWGF